MTKTKTKLTVFLILSGILIYSITELILPRVGAYGAGLGKEYNLVNYMTGETAEFNISVPKREVKPKFYGYNERVPSEVIENEIIKQAREFDLNPTQMVELAICESGLNNLAKNKKSTALGVYQYLIRTWEETESFKNKKIARTDYIANIREAMIDISNGESWRWEDCGKKVGLN